MKKATHNEVETATVFTCQSVDARSIFLAGTFNDWNPEITPMTRTEDGRWSISLDLAPGRYEYKFVVDGNWCCEPGRADWEGCSNCVRTDSDVHCSTCTPNDLGTMNKVVEVTGTERTLGSTA